MWPRIFLLLAICAVSFATNDTVKKLTICPPASDVSPCSCTSVSSVSLHCDSRTDTLTQVSLDRVIANMRTYNNIGPGEVLELDYFFFANSLVTRLNLNCLSQAEIHYFTIENNKYLIDITTPAPTFVQFGANAVFIEKNSLLMDAAVGQIFKYFRPDSVTGLWLKENSIYGATIDGSNFIPGLSSLSNVGAIHLENNKISRIAGGGFKRNLKLTQLYFENNTIISIGANAFAFDEPKAGTLSVTLDGNLLYDGVIDPNSGLNAHSNIAKFLYFKRNSFDTLSQKVFGPIFLDDLGGNVVEVNFQDNKFVCDQRLQWLRDARREVESNIKGVECTNDPGHSVFTTTLLKDSPGGAVGMGANLMVLIGSFVLSTNYLI